jgi:beta-N-acetylhexosaminidase
MRSKHLFLAVAVLLVLAACSSQKSLSPTTGQLTASHEDAEAWATQILEGLTLEQKAAQMLFEVLDTSYMAEDHPKFQYFIELVRDYDLGGFVLSGGTPQDAARMLNRLQQEAEIPVFVSNAFESGPGQMLRGASEFPPNMAFSAIADESIAEEAGRIGAQEGRAMGVHITWSPTVDILTRPENPVQGGRSFGGDLELLGRMAGAYIKGYQDNAMYATAKHFPGRGDVDLIPGTEFTANNKPADRVENEDFFAFKQAIDAGVTFIMSDHIAVPSVTGGSDLPGSVEPQLATYWLREKLGFQGILITDDMWYKKVMDRFGVVESCVMAIKAGHDAILKPGDAKATVHGLAEAVRKGEIPEEQVDRSVKKLLYYKARLNLHHNRYVDEKSVSSHVATQEHLEFVQKVADLSLTLLKNEGFFPVETNKVGKVFHLCVQRNPEDAAPAVASTKMAASFEVEDNITLRPDTAERLYNEALSAARRADTVVISLFNPRIRYIDNGPLRDQDLELIHRIVRIKPRATIVVSYGNPFPVEALKDATAFVLGYGEGGFYGNQLVYIDSFIKLMKGQLVPQGKLPIKVSENFPLGSGIVY